MRWVWIAGKQQACWRTGVQGVTHRGQFPDHRVAHGDQGAGIPCKATHVPRVPTRGYVAAVEVEFGSGRQEGLCASMESVNCAALAPNGDGAVGGDHERRLQLQNPAHASNYNADNLLVDARQTSRWHTEREHYS